MTKTEEPDYEVRAGVDIPPLRVGSGSEKYPWTEMGPGDSFLIPVDRQNFTARHKIQSAVQGNGRLWCNRHRPECKTVTRSVEDGIRVWMVSREPGA